MLTECGAHRREQVAAPTRGRAEFPDPTTKGPMATDHAGFRNSTTRFVFVPLLSLLTPHVCEVFVKR